MTVMRGRTVESTFVPLRENLGAKPRKSMLGAAFRLNKALVLRPIITPWVTHGTSLNTLACDPPAIDFDANFVTLPAASPPKNQGSSLMKITKLGGALLGAVFAVLSAV